MNHRPLLLEGPASPSPLGGAFIPEHASLNGGEIEGDVHISGQWRCILDVTGPSVCARPPARSPPPTPSPLSPRPKGHGCGPKGYLY